MCSSDLALISRPLLPLLPLSRLQQLPPPPATRHLSTSQPQQTATSLSSPSPSSSRPPPFFFPTAVPPSPTTSHHFTDHQSSPRPPAFLFSPITSFPLPRPPAAACLFFFSPLIDPCSRKEGSNLLLLHSSPNNWQPSPLLQQPSNCCSTGTEETTATDQNHRSSGFGGIIGVSEVSG